MFEGAGRDLEGGAHEVAEGVWERTAIWETTGRQRRRRSDKQWGGGHHDQRAPRKLDNALRHAHWRRPLLRLALLLLLGGGGHGAARLKRAQAALHRQRPRRKRVCRHEEAGGL